MNLIICFYELYSSGAMLKIRNGYRITKGTYVLYKRKEIWSLNGSKRRTQCSIGQPVWLLNTILYFN